MLLCLRQKHLAGPHLLLRQTREGGTQGLTQRAGARPSAAETLTRLRWLGKMGRVRLLSGISGSGPLFGIGVREGKGGQNLGVSIACASWEPR